MHAHGMTTWVLPTSVPSKSLRTRLPATLPAFGPVALSCGARKTRVPSAIIWPMTFPAPCSARMARLPKPVHSRPATRASVALATSRFLTQDPIGIDGGTNLYAYAGGDPVNNSDPSGARYRMTAQGYCQAMGNFTFTYTFEDGEFRITGVTKNYEYEDCMGGIGGGGVGASGCDILRDANCGRVGKLEQVVDACGGKLLDFAVAVLADGLQINRARAAKAAFGKAAKLWRQGSYLLDHPELRKPIEGAARVRAGDYFSALGEASLTTRRSVNSASGAIGIVEGTDALKIVGSLMFTGMGSAFAGWDAGKCVLGVVR